MKPVEKSWVPVINRSKPRKKSGLFPIGLTPDNHKIVRYIRIITPIRNDKIPRVPKKCMGFLRYFIKNT